MSVNETIAIEPEQWAEDYALEKLGRDAPPAARDVVRDAFLSGYLIGVLKAAPDPDRRAADPEDLKTPDRLSDEELIAWAERSGVYKESMEGTYLQFVVDEIRERRAAEAAFAEIDRRFQDVDCERCDEWPGHCDEHKGLERAWRHAREDLCEQTRIHRGYLRAQWKSMPEAPKP